MHYNPWLVTDRYAAHQFYDGGSYSNIFRERKPIVVIGCATYYPKAFSSNLKKQFELIFVDLKHLIPSYNPPTEELEKLTLEDFPYFPTNK